jgi:hypothetical protein
MQWKITMYFLFISLNISSSFEVEIKWSLLKEQAWLSLEEDFFLVSNENEKNKIGKNSSLYNFHENLGLHPKISHLNTFL